jgi:hypothetical protein
MIVVAMVAGWAAALYLVVIGADVLLLAFAGVLFALFLRGLAAGASWATGLPDATALGVVVALLVGLVASCTWCSSGGGAAPSASSTPWGTRCSGGSSARSPACC